ncbi:Fe-S cluster assembly sulfur transfer protein SufU [Diaminobutyricibacter sp. McL0618]|uniref:Fe-S cluster assembly sulfur transfer protein SufU n=1 Tax=Leifsonia sp. McL0618 TaxID=3415677 RepID=UPI003CE96915
MSDHGAATADGMPLRELYQEVIMDHARKPHGYGLTEPSDAESHQVNPTCGDEVTLRVRTDASGGRVETVSWEGHGCAISQASASLLFDVIRDLDREAVDARIGAFRTMMQSKGSIDGDEELLGDAVVLAGASRYVARIKCAMLAWVALEDALTRA